MLGGCGKERAMIRAELLRRLREDSPLSRVLARGRGSVAAAA